MNSINRFIRKAWKFFFIVNFIGTFLLLYPLYYLLFLNERTFTAAFKVMRLWAKYLALSAGIRYEKISENQLPEGPYIICPNHSSYFDIILTYCIFPDYFVFMGKKELGSVPLFNIFFKKMNILVDRKSNSGSHRAFKEAEKELEKGHSVAIFPEGTISKKAPRLSKFKNGAFKLAAEKQIPVIPVTYLNNWKIMGDGHFWNAPCGPGKALVYIHPQITVNSLTEADIESAKNHVFSLLENKISESLQEQKNIKPLTI